MVQKTASTFVLVVSEKSYMVALTIMRNVLEMPGSTGVFIASSFRQAHARTLPSALQAMDAFGWKEGFISYRQKT
jgi:hypothetical protein